MGMKKAIWISLISSILLLAACGNKEETSSPVKDDSKSKTEETSSKSTKASSKSKQGFDEINAYIKEESEGNIKVIYTNKDAQYSHDMNGFKVSVGEYQILKVTDMNEDSKILFDDQIDGYIISSKVTFENGAEKPMYYASNNRIQLSNSYDSITSDWKNFVPEDQQIYRIKKNQDEFTLFEAGEKVTGIMTFTLTNEEFEKLKSVKPKYIIEGGVADNENSKDSYLQNSPAYDFIYNDDQAKELAGQPTFYQDRLTSDNWADKKMIFEKLGINEMQQIGDVKVTLEGVQYTEVLPTEANKEMFTDFGDSGVTALTAKFKIDNQSSAPLSISNVSTVLIVDDNRVRYLSQGMAEPSGQPLELASGQQIEKLHVFLFRTDEFQLYKKFDLKYGPFIEKNGEEAFKGRTATFALPR